MQYRILIVSVSTACLLLATAWLRSRPIARAEGPGPSIEEPSRSPPDGMAESGSSGRRDRQTEWFRDPWAPVQPRGADNSPCHVCHTRFEQEPLSEMHRKVNVGCVKCHGPSLAHRDDEDNLVPPDVMYWPERIDPSCVECHPKHNAPAREVLTRWRERCSEKTDPQSVACIDCHGEHRLTSRTVRWDKKTGDLLGHPEKQKVDRGDEAAPSAPDSATP